MSMLESETETVGKSTFRVRIQNVGSILSPQILPHLLGFHSILSFCCINTFVGINSELSTITSQHWGY